jgi:hypothetical protein
VLYPALLALLAADGPPVSPVDSAANSVVVYWLSFGAIAVIAFIEFWLYVWPGKLTRQSKAEARADLLKELERLLADNIKLAEQRDEALRVARDQIAPLLYSFNATTGALLPVLQDLVRQAEARRQP